MKLRLILVFLVFVFVFSVATHGVAAATNPDAATLTNTGVESITIIAIFYVGQGQVYVVPLNYQPPPFNWGSWLTQSGWSPSAAWSGWQYWGVSGTPLPGGYRGYNWYGFPFITDGTFNGAGVTILSDQNLTVPYVPGYAVGFVASTGNAWWAT